jgi:hypothetical protein
VTAKVWIPREGQAKVLERIRGVRRKVLTLPTGEGKTVLAATWLAEGIQDLTVGRCLIVAPKLVATSSWSGPISVWRTWTHLEWMAPGVRSIPFEMLGLKRGTEGLEFRDKKQSKGDIEGLGGYIHVCSWEAFPWVVKAFGGSWPYDTLILDESSFIKDHKSERSKAARHVVKRLCKVENLLLLTATPASNHEEAVYAQVDLVEPGILGKSLTEFREVWCEAKAKDWRSGQVYSWRVRPVLADDFAKVCAKVCVSLPKSLRVPLVEAPRRVQPSERAREALEALERHSCWGDVVCPNAAVVHARKRQVCNGFVYRGRDVDSEVDPVDVDEVKMGELEELLESIDTPVVIVYQWIEELRRLRAKLGKRMVEINQKGAMERFISGGVKYLVLNPKSAGHGVDGLQLVSNDIVWVSVPEDRELYDQTNGRLHRTGTKASTVYVHVLIAAGTVEQDIWEKVLPEKKEMQDRIISAAL